MITEFITYLEQQKNKCLERGEKLNSDERKDEANLCKVEANIYEIFETLYQTSCKKVPDGDEAMIKKKFMDFTQKIPLNWKKSLEMAKQHDDTTKAVIEEIKLNTVEKIVQEYRKQVAM